MVTLDDLMVYPQLIGLRFNFLVVPPPSFPPTCPACGAACRGSHSTRADYACGGAYTRQDGGRPADTIYFGGACGQSPRHADEGGPLDLGEGFDLA